MDTNKLTTDTKTLTMAYWCAMGITIIAVFLPWLGVSESINIPGVVSHSESMHWLGISMWPGVLTFIVALAGGAASIVGAHKLLRENTKFAMTGVGAAIVLLAIINMIRIHANTSGDSVESAVGSAKISVSGSIGTWLALLAGLVAAGAGWLINWAQAPVLVKIPALEAMGAGGQGLPVSPAAPAAPAAPVAPVPPPVAAAPVASEQAAPAPPETPV